MHDDAEILDSQISASSSDGESGFEAWQARLGNEYYWRPFSDALLSWIEVDFLKVVFITGIKTQAASKGVQEWVKKMRLKYKDSEEGHLMAIFASGDSKVRLQKQIIFEQC